MLLRRFLGERLAEYYAQPSSRVVGYTSQESIPFASLWGEWHWRRVYRRVYDTIEGQWLTPVELFAPYYSNILANFVAEETRNAMTSRRIDIVELGGGRGTNGQLLLTHLQRAHPQIYDKVSYTIIDSSPSLIQQQKDMLCHGQHATKLTFQLTDLLDVAEEKVPLLEKSDDATVVLALELFDNLPHDKIRRDLTTRQLEQAEVDAVTGEEVFLPATDATLLKTLESLPSYGATGSPTWIPTVGCGVLKRLGEVRPNASLIVADFDWLPPPDLPADSLPSQRKSNPAKGEPLVTSMEGVDYETYLDAPKYCDILFPTDFPKLAAFVRSTWSEGAIVTTQKQSMFLQQYGPSEVKSTQSWLTGFSPLIHDFGNCSVLKVTRREIC